MAWDIFYGCTGSAFRLTAVKVGDEVVLTENIEGKMRYVFSEITADTFRWRKEYLAYEGHWTVVAIVTVVRKKCSSSSGYQVFSSTMTLEEQERNLGAWHPED